MTNKPKTADWRNLPIEQWNTTTVHAYLIDRTRELYGVEYVPGGKGTRSQRWSAEKGMIKRELTNKGAELVRKFIDVCWREYKTNNPGRYPYPTFGFMLGWMDWCWTVAERESAANAAEQVADDIDMDDVLKYL